MSDLLHNNPGLDLVDAAVRAMGMDEYQELHEDPDRDNLPPFQRETTEYLVTVRVKSVVEGYGDEVDRLQAFDVRCLKEWAAKAVQMGIGVGEVVEAIVSEVE